MGTLIGNLQTIYTVKNQIKEVIGTNSDLFEDYPGLIEDAIEAGGGEGLDWDDVATAGYIIPAGTLNVSANGNNINVASYAYANVNVPIPAGYIQPSGTITIDDSVNGTTVDVSTYAYADVEVISSGGGYDYDIFYSDVYLFNEISYEMFDLSNYLQNNPYENGWTSKNMSTVIEGSSYIYQGFYTIPLGNIDLTTHFSGMNPDTTGYGENSQWKIYDDSNSEQNVYNVTPLFNFSTGEQWAHIQYQNNSGADQFIKFARVPMTWDSMGSQWNTDTSGETEINGMPVVTYDEYGASATHNGTYMFLEDGNYIDLYLRFYYGDMGDPDSCEVYSGNGNTMNGEPTHWYNIENTNLGKINFIEYDENNWPPQA